MHGSVIFVVLVACLCKFPRRPTGVEGMDFDHDDDHHDGPPRRRLQAYSLEQKVKYLDEYWLAHLEGLHHGRNGAEFARFRNIRETTFRHWLQHEDDLRMTYEESQRRRRMRRYRQLGNGEC